MGIFSAINNLYGNNNLNGIKKVEEVEEIKEVKVLTMNELFNELKEKISEYEELSRSSESVEVDNSEIFKIEEEIKNLKAKIDELNSSIEGKSKIEKMKITLNVTSIESEITLKEMDLEEQKQKAQKEYGQKVKSSKKDLENVKDNLNTFIKDTEENLENAIKDKYTKEKLENAVKDNLKKQSLSHSEKLRLAREKMFVQNLNDLEKQGLNKLGLTVSDLSGITLNNSELDALTNISSYTEKELKNLYIGETNNVDVNNINESSFGNFTNPLLLEMSIRIKNANINNLKRLIDIRNNKISKELIEKARQKLIEGTDLEETKNYFENIMKTELLNLKNIEEQRKELDEKIKVIREKSGEYYNRANECYDKMALDENEKIVTFKKEQEKLEIKKEAIQNKINTVNEMVDEMIKEVIKEEMKKREIVIPDFVPVTKYFNAPDEVEE